MEKLEHKYKTLQRSQNALERALDLYTEKYQQAAQAEQEAYTTSVIKHFELFYETFWKFLKVYLYVVFGVEAIGSKAILKACHEQKIISNEDLQVLLNIIEIRNNTVHVY